MAVCVSVCVCNGCVCVCVCACICVCVCACRCVFPILLIFLWLGLLCFMEQVLAHLWALAAASEFQLCGRENVFKSVDNFQSESSCHKNTSGKTKMLPNQHSSRQGSLNSLNTPDLANQAQFRCSGKQSGVLEARKDRKYDLNKHAKAPDTSWHNSREVTLRTSAGGGEDTFQNLPCPYWAEL